VALKLADQIAIVDRRFETFFAGRPAPALAYGLVSDGRLVHAGGLGSIDRDGGPAPDAASIFRIASLTKMFTAATVLILRDGGRISLDDAAAIHVTELTGWNGPTTDSPPITIRHLLTMGAGLPTDDPWADRLQGASQSEFIAILRRGVALAAPPDLGFEYSNLGYAILGRVITAVTGLEYASAVSGLLLKPLGLDATGFEAAQLPGEPVAGFVGRDGGWEPEPIDPYGAFAPMGGLFSCVGDLARWMAWLADAFPPRDAPDAGEPLCRASRREMQQLRRLSRIEGHGSRLADPPRVLASGYGYGLGVEHDAWRGVFMGHSGGYPGYGAYVRWHPASRLGIVALANSRYAPVRTVTREALDELIDCGAGPERRQPRPAALESAREAADELLENWDDAAVERLCAANVAMDEPIERRRRSLDELKARLGPLGADDSAEPLSDSAGHMAWWLNGQGGRGRVDALLDPETPPRIQGLALEAAIDPSARLRAVAEAMLAYLEPAPPAWPPAEPGLADTLDEAAVARTLAVARAWFGRGSLGRAVAGDGVTAATFPVSVAWGTLTMRMELDPDSGKLVVFDLSPRSRGSVAD
jgi:CubicO group peptidase (beta-lactamase class C family)